MTLIINDSHHNLISDLIWIGVFVVHFYSMILVLGVKILWQWKIGFQISYDKKTRF